MESNYEEDGKGLECHLCFELFTEPIQLSCSHTFCKKCLDQLYESKLPGQANKLACPTCCQITNVNNGDVSKLQPNVQLSSMVEDVKSTKRSCTVCDPEAETPAVLYCTQCGEYMCDPCAVVHENWKKNAKHDVVSVDDVKVGKVKVKRFCNKHPEEEKLYICTTCNESICFMCRMSDHTKLAHKVKEVSDFRNLTQKRIESLQERVKTRIAAIEAHAALTSEQRAVVETELDQRVAEINQAYEEAVQRLVRQRDDLIDRCKQEKETLVAQLQKIKDTDDKHMSCIRSASELVGNGMKTLLEGQSLVVHNKISCDLEKTLDKSNPDTQQLKSIADLAKGFKLVRSSASLNLGDLKQTHSWQLKEVSSIPLSHDFPLDAVPLSGGRVAIGYWNGRVVEVFTVAGPLETVLRDVEVYNAAVLSDGRYVVREAGDIITLYTTAGERLDVQFDTPSSTDGDLGGMCVDRGDNIYVGYRKKRKIVVFRPEGGAPLREIPCHDSEPLEICHMNHSKRLVVYTGSKSVMVVDDVSGTVHHRVQVDSSCTCIAVPKDDDILIARWKDCQLSIELYTEDLKRIRTVLGDYPIIGVLAICKLVEVSTREIVVVSGDKFIVFCKI